MGSIKVTKEPHKKNKLSWYCCFDCNGKKPKGGDHRGARPKWRDYLKDIRKIKR